MIKLKLKKHNKLYYLKDKPLITDKDYDILKNEILKLEDKYPFLKIKFPIQKYWF